MSSHLFSQDVVPIGTGYLILMGVLAVGLRMQRKSAALTGEDESGGKVPGRVTRRFSPGWPRFLAHIVATALGGYILLMVVDVLYYFGVARVAGQFLASGFTGSALLLAVTLPLFAARSWLSDRRRRARDPVSGESSAKPS